MRNSESFHGPAKKDEEKLSSAGRQEGDNAFKAALLEQRAPLMAHAMMLAKNSDKAEDLVQETFLRALANQHTFVLGTNLAAWLHAILRNSFLNQYHKDKYRGTWVKSPQTVKEEEIERSPAINSPESKSLVGDILEELEKLSPEHRRVVEVVGIYGYKYEEAAVILGVNVGTVKSRLNRAREILREKLEINEDIV